MFGARKMGILVVIILVAAVAWATAAGSAVDQKGVLAGKVLANELTIVGANVHEGDTLVAVDTIAGPVPAVRANIDGKVKDVLVKPGDEIKVGDVLVRIEPAHN
jgi:biotin carboxyl carrier protein